MDTLDNNETNKAPSVRSINEALSTKADIINGKIPLSQLPQPLYGINELHYHTKTSNVIFDKFQDERYTIGQQLPMDTIESRFSSNIEKSDEVVDTNYSFTDICYCDHLDIFCAIAGNCNQLFKSKNGILRDRKSVV